MLICAVPFDSCHKLWRQWHNYIYTPPLRTVVCLQLPSFFSSKLRIACRLHADCGECTISSQWQCHLECRGADWPTCSVSDALDDVSPVILALFMS
jgi:hypothetical protein